MACSNFSKICEDISSSSCTTCVIDTCGKWKKSAIRKFSIIFFTPLASRVNTFSKFALVPLTPMANLLPVSKAQAVVVAKFDAGVVDTGGKFAAGVVDINGARIFPQIYEKI
jgi:hypothetical protein